MKPKTGFTHQLKDGQKYMDTWPMRKELNAMFPEQRHDQSHPLCHESDARCRGDQRTDPDGV